MKKTIKEILFPNNEFYQKYRHVGYSHIDVPIYWKQAIQDTVIKIEKLMWPRWMPFWLKRLIHYLATDNSVIRVKYRWANKLRNKLTNGSIITDIKEKYATLRIYGYFAEEMYRVIEEAEVTCSNTCEQCGGNEETKVSKVNGWYHVLCEKCLEFNEMRFNTNKNKNL